MTDYYNFQLVPRHQYAGLPIALGEAATIPRIGVALQHSCVAPPWRFLATSARF